MSSLRITIEALIIQSLIFIQLSKGIEYLRDKSLVRSPEMMKLNLETKSNLNKEISKFTLKNEARGLISPHFTYNIALVQQVNEFKDILVKLFDLIDPLDILTLSILM